MLILTRRPDETICVGNDIKITVLSVNRNQVRIGVEAPRNVQVDREEVFLRKCAENGCSEAAPVSPRAFNTLRLHK